MSTEVMGYPHADGTEPSPLEIEFRQVRFALGHEPELPSATIVQVQDDPLLREWKQFAAIVAANE